MTLFTPRVIVVLFSQARHPQGLNSAVDTGIAFDALPLSDFTFLPLSFV